MINSSVIDVLQGQQNDRIALFYSGVNLYLEAQSVNNPEMKNALLAQAIRALSDGTQQLALTMESDIEYLTSKQYNKIKGKKVEDALKIGDDILVKVTEINKEEGKFSLTAKDLMKV